MKQSRIQIDDAVFQLISLPGHSVGHTGVVTPDGICCIGDAIVSEDVLRVSKMPYMAYWKIILHKSSHKRNREDEDAKHTCTCGGRRCVRNGCSD